MAPKNGNNMSRVAQAAIAIFIIMVAASVITVKLHSPSQALVRVAGDRSISEELAHPNWIYWVTVKPGEDLVTVSRRLVKERGHGYELTPREAVGLVTVWDLPVVTVQRHDGTLVPLLHAGDTVGYREKDFWYIRRGNESLRQAAISE